jgi:hypothetical protein
MVKGLSCNPNGRGQSLTESLLMMPLFFVIVFGLLQVCQLGLAVMMVNYTSASIARKAASENSFPSTSRSLAVPANIMSLYQPKANGLMVAGMQLEGLQGCIDSSAPTADLSVAVRAKIEAWPFFADVLHAALQSQYDPPPLGCGGTGYLPFGFSPGPAPYFFYVTGKSSARLNYVQ